MPHLNVAGDGLARELVFSRLRNVPESLTRFDILPIIQHELADLKRYDLPFVSARPSGKTVFFDETRALEGATGRPAIAQIKARLGAFNNLAHDTIQSYAPRA